MKSKEQKQKEIDKGKKLLKDSKFIILFDFSNIKNEDVVVLRRNLKNNGSSVIVMKKRLLELILKDNEIGFNSREFKTSIASIFTNDLESTASIVYKFLKGLESDKKIKSKAADKIIRGFDAISKDAIEKDKIVFLGSLPPKEIILSQLVGMISYPIKSLLYILNQRAERSH